MSAYIVDVNLDDDAPWIPYTEGLWVQLCRFNVTTGGFATVLKGLPGARLSVRYHTGSVHGITLRGLWRYLERDWIAKPVRLLTSQQEKHIRSSSRTIARNRQSSPSSLKAH